jgi:hypothetical protein
MNPAQNTRYGQRRRFATGEVVTTLRSVRQDNPAHTTAPSGIPQPAPKEKDARTTPKVIGTKNTQQKNSALGKDVQLNLWVRPVVKAELERVAKREGLSISAAGEAFLEKALHQDIYAQHGALLETILDKAVGKHMRSYSNRLAVLLVRSIFAGEQTRAIVTNILSRQQGVNQNVLEKILDGSSDTAKRNITRITPQLATLVKEVEAWIQEQQV